MYFHTRLYICELDTNRTTFNLHVGVCGLKGTDRKCVYIEKKAVASNITRP